MNDSVTLYIHYIRPDGDYTGWNLWVWGLGRTPGQYDFSPLEGHRVVKLTLPGHQTQYLSFIPRCSVPGNCWSQQEFGERRVDLSDLVSGTVHCYVDSGKYETSRVTESDVVFANKIRRAELDYDGNRILVNTVKPLADPAQALCLHYKGEPVSITCAAEQYGTYVLTPSRPLRLWELYQYQVIFAGFAYDICYLSTYDSHKFHREFTYDGDDLGSRYTPHATEFALWAPTAESVQVRLYTTGSDLENNAAFLGSHTMVKTEKGVWRCRLEQDLEGIYYTYLVHVDGQTAEVCDPYAFTTGVNGGRAMVIDLQRTDPAGWETDENPNKLQSYTDAIIYEVHLRDYSIHPGSGIRETLRGKYLSLTQSDTVTRGGMSTGLDHMKQLGITHVHLLPIYDYGSVDETACNCFNWGYDPVNYNVPDGSYATNPYDGHVRVKELKEMVACLHQNGISVIMDVVYNHVYQAETFAFNRIVPGYFSRHNPDGSLSNGSGCGNDTASERPMVRKYIVQSVLYWAQQYHINGFRFDLVGLLDAATINQLVQTVHAQFPDVIFYGEGWSMQTAVKEGTPMATQVNAAQTPHFAYFSDTIRNLLTGTNGESLGYASGAQGLEYELVRNFMANPWFTDDPNQVIQYASCHDNHTLLAKLLLSHGKLEADWDIVRMNKLTAAIYLTAQGIPFIHAGEEMLRLKIRDDGSFSENSYNAPDSVNAIRWNLLDTQTGAELSQYYAGLIALRKQCPALRLNSAEKIARQVQYLWARDNVVQFLVDENICIIFNPNHHGITASLPQGQWQVYVDGESAGTEPLYDAHDFIKVPGISAMVLKKA